MSIEKRAGPRCLSCFDTGIKDYMVVGCAALPVYCSCEAGYNNAGPIEQPKQETWRDRPPLL